MKTICYIIYYIIVFICKRSNIYITYINNISIYTPYFFISTNLNVRQNYPRNRDHIWEKQVRENEFLSREIVSRHFLHIYFHRFTPVAQIYFLFMYSVHCVQCTLCTVCIVYSTPLQAKSTRSLWCSRGVHIDPYKFWRYSYELL